MSIVISPPKTIEKCKLFCCTQDPSESQEKFITDLALTLATNL